MARSPPREPRLALGHERADALDEVLRARRLLLDLGLQGELLVQAGEHRGVELALGARVRARRPGGQAGGERVDLYFTDGSMISFAAGSPEADRLVPLARDVLSAARG